MTDRKDMFFQVDTLSRIGDFLKIRGEQVAVAESATAGFLQLAISQIPFASLVYKGGITAYALKEKVALLHVDPRLAEKSDCVSLEIATQMAVGVARLFNSEWSIGTTGYATPVAASGYKCFVFFSICHRNEPLVEKKIETGETNIYHGQIAVQHFYVEKILQEWRICLGLT